MYLNEMKSFLFYNRKGDFLCVPCTIIKASLLWFALNSFSDPSPLLNIYWTLNLASLQKAQDSAAWLESRERDFLLSHRCWFSRLYDLTVVFFCNVDVSSCFLNSLVRHLPPFGSVTPSIKLIIIISNSLQLSVDLNYLLFISLGV